VKRAGLFFSLACAGLFAGCDRGIVPDAFDRRSRRESADRQESDARCEQEADKSRSLVSERQAVRVSLSAADSVVSNEIARIGREVTTLASDRRRLSDQIKKMSARSPKSGERAHLDVLLALLDDDVVNELAMRYLGHDFRLARLEIADGIADLTKAEKQKEAALSENKAAYDEQREEAKAESAHARASVQQSIQKLQAELSDLKGRREKLTKRLHFVSVTERRRLESELKDIDSQERSLKNSYDSLRVSRVVSDGRAKAERDAMSSVDMAERRRAASDDRVRRQFSGQKDAGTLVSESETATVRALEKEMAVRNERLGRSLAEARKAQSLIRASLAGVDGLGAGALKKVRDEMDGLMDKVPF